MDLKSLESTSTLAIRAVYDHFWNLIPRKYKLPEDDEMIKDLSPFYDPQLNFDNRLHYKLSKVEYPKRATPWFIITWNTENGLINSSLTRRRFQTMVVDSDKYGKVRCKFINTDLQINFGICCNSMQALFELQENIVLGQREKKVVHTKPHSLIGSFPVSLNIIDSNQNKLERDKSTLCYLFMQCKIDYPIIGMLESKPFGVIEEIHNDINSEFTELNLTKDVIDEDTDVSSLLIENGYGFKF